jgi:hypothetical protein
VELLTVEVELGVEDPPHAESRNKKDRAVQLALSGILLYDLFSRFLYSSRPIYVDRDCKFA